MPLVYGLSNITCEAQREAVCAGRADRRRDRQPHLALTRPNRDRRPVGWQSVLHAGRSQEPGRPHHLLGRQPGRVPPAALHQVHAHAEGQVRAQRPQGPHDGAGGHPRDAEREGRRHLPAGPAGQGLRGASPSCGPWSRASAVDPEARRRDGPDAGAAPGPRRPDEDGQVRRAVLRHGPVDDARQAHELGGRC